MQLHLIELIRSLAALAAGGVIGATFGFIQNAALRRNEKLQQSGNLNNAWAIMPGSMRRVAYLMVLLVIIQIVCPLLFVNGSQWWVSGGVVAGYACVLWLRLSHRKA